MPGAHVEADELVVEGLLKLTNRQAPATPLSINDFGAGVGQARPIGRTHVAH